MWEWLSLSRSLDPLELALRYQSGLRVLQEHVRRRSAVTDPPSPVDPRIEQLLGKAGEPTWEDLYEAEQRLIDYLGPEEIQAEATRRFTEATKLGLPSATAIKDAFAAATTPRERAEQFRVLLDELHWQYTKRRLDRRTRTRAARVLSVCGTALIVLALALLALFCRLTNDWAIYAQVAAVVVFGVVGAFFSRMTAFQSQAEGLDYEKLVAMFQMRNVWVRLTVGAIGALVFWFVLSAGLVAGQMFPDMSKAASQGNERIVFFASLIFWSFLAGFSERLVSSTLERLESQAQQPRPTAQG